MLTSKQRSFLRALGTKEKAVLQIGKNAVTPDVIESISQCIEKRELVKITVLENCENTPREVADLISGRTRSEVVTVIGRKIVLYRPANEPVIVLPKAK